MSVFGTGAFSWAVKFLEISEETPDPGAKKNFEEDQESLVPRHAGDMRCLTWPVIAGHLGFFVAKHLFIKSWLDLGDGFRTKSKSRWLVSVYVFCFC